MVCVLRTTDDANISGDNSSDLALSDVMVGSGTDDSTFQQLAENGSLLDGLEFPMDTLSQLPATPPRSRTDNGTALLSPPSTVSNYIRRQLIACENCRIIADVWTKNICIYM